MSREETDAKNTFLTYFHYVSSFSLLTRDSQALRRAQVAIPEFVRLKANFHSPQCLPQRGPALGGGDGMISERRDGFRSFDIRHAAGEAQTARIRRDVWLPAPNDLHFSRPAWVLFPPTRPPSRVAG